MISWLLFFPTVLAMVFAAWWPMEEQTLKRDEQVREISVMAVCVLSYAAGYFMH